MNEFMTVETTNVYGCPCLSMQSTVDVQNGAVVGKGDLVTGEDSIYVAIDDYSAGIYLVANPAWSYDTSRKVNQNEENYVNKAGIPFRVYGLKKDSKYTIGNVPVAFEVGDYVEFKNGAYAKASGDTRLKVVHIEQVGFPYFVGQFGTVIAGDSDNEYGYAVDARVKKYTIEVQ